NRDVCQRHEGARRPLVSIRSEQTPQAVAFATARLAITAIRLARYSGDAWRSPIRSFDGTLTPSSAEALNDLTSAASISLERNTPLSPAPVTATRTPSLPFAAKTPTIA